MILVVDEVRQDQRARLGLEHVDVEDEEMIAERALGFVIDDVGRENGLPTSAACRS